VGSYSYSRALSRGVVSAGKGDNVTTECRLVDGAILRTDGADASAPVTSQAFFDVGERAPQLLRAKPAGFSRNLDAWHARGDFADRDFIVHARQERPWKDGVLRLAEVSHATGSGVRRELSFVFFEHANGCLVLTRAGRTLDDTRTLFERLPVDTAPDGVSVRLPVVSDLRPPSALVHVPSLGQLAITPLTASVLRQLPSSPGYRVAHGELYRASARSNAVLFVSPTCRVMIVPELGTVDITAAQRLAVEWVKN
jgi:hypothetical protein